MDWSIVMVFKNILMFVYLQVTLEATKQFVDAQGITQTAVISRRTHVFEPGVLSHLVGDLSPFTTYSVNVSAVPSDQQYRPPARITVTTQMAGKLSFNKDCLNIC